MFFKRLRYIKDEYRYNFTPEEVWPFIVNPLTRQSFEDESCYQVESMSQTTEALTSKWTEKHIGEPCTGDVFDWIVTVSDGPHIYQMTSSQHGIRRTVTYTLAADGNGCVLSEELIYTPIFSKKIGSMFALWSQQCKLKALSPYLGIIFCL